MIRPYKNKYFFSLYALIILFSLTSLSFLILTSSKVSADNDSIVDDVAVTIPLACTMSGTGMNTHIASITNGTYQANIGTTTLHVFCNDNEGFAIYAAGYTGGEISGTNSNKLVGTSASSNATIVTGLATSTPNPDVSNWAMKLAISQDSGNTTGTNAFAIDSDTEGSFSAYHTVPNEYVKVAHKNSGTDMTTNTGGAKLTTTYAAYISKTQPADTYTGQVIYTMVHPSNHATPIANPATLDTGQIVNSKLKSLAATVVNGEETTIWQSFDPDNWEGEEAYDKYVKSIDVHLKTPAPAGFTPTTANTISSSTSVKPIYIVFDNTNDAGIMHFYTEGDQIVLSPDSSFTFYLFNELAEISGISDWNTSNATDMSYMFYYTGDSVSTFTLDLSDWNTSSVTNMYRTFAGAFKSASTFSLNLSDWDTSNVTDMSRMFESAGYYATTWSVGDLSSWDTLNVTNYTGMEYMFSSAGYSATTFTLDLSSWNTSNVTNMEGMFIYAGYNAATFALDLSSWDTSSLRFANHMFNSAGYNATTWSVDGLSSWNTSNVETTSSMFQRAGYSASTIALDLSSWNTSKVTNMQNMFTNFGYSATSWSIGDLSSWDTSNVIHMVRMFYQAGRSANTFTLNLSSWNTSKAYYMTDMFSNAGYSATTWSITIPSTNGNNISNTTSRLYGQSTSEYGEPPSGRSFTLAQP